jgi:hypothetical protein
MVSFVVKDRWGERVGSAEYDALPRPGDKLIMRHPDDAGPTYEVLRCEFVNGDIEVIVRSVERAS